VQINNFCNKGQHTEFDLLMQKIKQQQRTRSPNKRLSSTSNLEGYLKRKNNRTIYNKKLKRNQVIKKPKFTSQFDNAKLLNNFTSKVKLYKPHYNGFKRRTCAKKDFAQQFAQKMHNYRVHHGQMPNGGRDILQ
jgi:hypothetical protein